MSEISSEDPMRAPADASETAPSAETVQRPSEEPAGGATPPPTASQPSPVASAQGATPPPGTPPASIVHEKTESPAVLPGSVEVPPEDQVRRGLAFFVLWIVAGVIAAGMVLTALTPMLGLEPERIQSTVQLFFTATITLAGTVFGFYFATRNR